jgi:hypothetical protein
LQRTLLSDHPKNNLILPDKKPPNIDQIIISTDMDKKSRNFSQFIATLIDKANCATPSNNATTKPRRRSLARNKVESPQGWEHDASNKGKQ